MGRLDVRIVEARNLPNTETFGKPDPYVKVTLENTEHKTSVADGTLSPKWDEVFKFVVADPDSAQLTLKLFDKNMVSDAYMGEYKMSISGLTKGVVKDVWCLLQQCKANAEIHIRLMAHDFGAEPAPGAAAVPQPVAQPVVQQPVYQQPVVQQQPVYQQPVMQQPVYQQQQQYPMGQPMYQQPQPGYPPQQQQPMGMMGQMGMAMGQMMAGMQQMTQNVQMGINQGMMMNQAPAQTFADFQFVQLRGPVRRATYGPVGSNNDVTMAINGLVQQGRLQIHGGIHTAIGDPFPGVPKQFSVWY